MDSPPPGKSSNPIPIPDRKKEPVDDELSELRPAQWQHKTVDKSSLDIEPSFDSETPSFSVDSQERRRLMSMQPQHSTSSHRGSSEGRSRAFTMATATVDPDIAACLDEGFWEELKQKLANKDSGHFESHLADQLAAYNEDDDIPLDDDGYESTASPLPGTPSSFRTRLLTLHTAVDESAEESVEELTLPADQADELRHTDIRNKSSLLCKALNKIKLDKDKLSPFELSHMQTRARDYISQLPPASITEDSLVTFLLGHRTLLEELLPNSCRHLKNHQHANSPFVLSSFKPAFINKTDRLAWKELVRKTVQLLEEPVYEREKDAIDDQQRLKEAGEILDEWTQFTSTQKKGLKPEFKAQLETDLSHISQVITNYIQAIEVIAQNDFRSEENFRHSLNLQFQAAIEVLANKGGSAESQTRLIELQQKAFLRADHRHNMIGKLLGCQKKIVEILKTQNLQNEYQPCLIKHLQRSEGTSPILKSLMLRYGGTYHRCEMEYLPAALLKPPTPDDELSELESPSDLFYPGYKGVFCPSMKRDERRHAIDLMNLVVRMTGIDKPVYQETRVGIPYAFAVDPYRRNSVTNLRFNEMLTAALLQKKPKELAEAMADQNHAPIELPVFYKCLLSPDKARPHLFEHPINDPELVWCEIARNKIRIINDRGPTYISMRDHKGDEKKILVKPKIHLFIDPCNNMAFTKLGALAGTWELADEVNRKTLRELMGSLQPGAPITGPVEALLKDDTALPEIKQELSELVQHIRYMYENNRHHKLTNNPFYTSDLTSELCNLLDMANVIGCKSAKDRTGLKSASSIKFTIDCFMARTRWLVNGKKGYIVPKPGTPLTYQDILNACQLTLNSGQEENQLKNTAIPGFKVPSYMLGAARKTNPWVNRNVSVDTAWLK